MRNILIWLMCTAVFSMAHSKQPSLVDFIKPSEFKRLSISPDGKRLAGILEMENGADKVAVLDLSSMKPLGAKDFGDNRKVMQLAWVNNEQILLNVNKQVGYLDRKGEWEGLYSMRFDGKRDRLVVNMDNSYGALIVDGWPQEKDQVLLQIYEAGGLHLYAYNLKSDRKSRFSEPADKYALAPSVNINRKAVVAPAYDPKLRSSYIYYKHEDSDDWRKLELGEDLEGVNVDYVGYAQDPDIVYLRANHDDSLNGLFQLNVASGELKMLYRHDRVDLGDPVQGFDGELIGMQMMPDTVQHVWVDNDNPMTALYKQLTANFPGQVLNLYNHTLNGNKVVFSVSSDTNPGEFFMLDRKARKIKPLAKTRGWINPADMAPMKPVALTARDGTELYGYLTVPKTGQAPYPLVVNPHGGPHGPRDEWGYNWETQLLASRGYAVLQVNFRGSGGYGRNFEVAGYMQWGRAMQDDVTDATRWAIEHGVADAQRVCIYGGSYGGYATLQGLVREPDLYQCGIGYVGVYDLKKFRVCGDIPQGHYGKDYLNRVIGQDGAELEQYSPAQNVDKIKAAIFLAHGEDDVRVPMCQYNALTEALDAAGKPYESMTRDEGHGYNKLDNRKDFYSAMLKFLDRHIGAKN